MSLSTGTKIGPYEIVTPLGAGGMGEVYRAKDTRLQRDVAIKALPEAFAEDVERLARFEREARLLASLNHPNIAGIFGLEEVDGRRYLALELVEGESLEQRLARGPLPVDEAVDVCRQVAAALEAAHESGIIHRDLKPGNVMLTEGGDAKVLDFGLARGQAASPSDVDLSRSPTMTHAATSAGVILGTAAYMSPEQSRGKAVDRRTDIWSFGCLLYECLTGQQAFGGETFSDIIARILQGEPEWNALPAATPVSVRRLLERCLDKDPKKRLRDAGDARLELDEARTERTSKIRSARMGKASESSALSTLLRGLLPGLLAGAAITALVFAFVKPFSRSGGSPAASARVSIHIPEDLTVFTGGLNTAALRDLTSDGTALVVNGRPPTGDNRLYVRFLDSDGFKPLPGTENSFGTPSIAADGRTVFYLSGIGDSRQVRLARTPLDGSAPPTAICDVASGYFDFVPLPDGSILFLHNDGRRFLKISASGQPLGDAVTITSPDSAMAFDVRNLGAEAVLDRKTLLIGTTYFTDAGWYKGVALLDIETGNAAPLLQDAGAARYVEPGFLVFSRGDQLLAVRFDLKKRAMTGEPQTVYQGVRTAGSFVPGTFKLSAGGTLVHAPGGAIQEGRGLGLVDLDGHITPWSADRKVFNDNYPISISNDGKWMALVVTNARGVDEIWGSETGTPFLRRMLAVPKADLGSPLLSADGAWIAFRRVGRNEADGIYVRRVDDVGEGTRVQTTPPGNARPSPSSWAPDRSALLYTFSSADNSRKLHLVRLGTTGEPDGDPRLLFDGPGSDVNGSFSPDGNWIAFESNRFGSWQVLACAYHGNGTVGNIVSLTRSGSNPQWSGDGRRIFFSDSTFVKSVNITTTGGLHASEPATVWEADESIATGGLLPDGRAIVVLQSEEERRVSRFDVVLNWTREVEAMMAGKH